MSKDLLLKIPPNTSCKQAFILHLEGLIAGVLVQGCIQNHIDQSILLDWKAIGVQGIAPCVYTTVWFLVEAPVRGPLQIDQNN